MIEERWEIEMNKELIELFEQRMMIFSKRDDVEKLRQETNANFRKLKEENKELILGWIEGMKAEIEALKREGKVMIDPLRKEIKEEVKNVELKIQSILSQSIQSVESSIHQSKQDIGSNLQTTKDEYNTAILQSRQEMASYLQLIKEERKTDLAQSQEKTSGQLDRLGEKVGNLNDQIRMTIEEIAALDDKLKAGFNEVKEELGSMIKFSYADLEKRFATLEARVKALEKLVLP